MKLPEIFERHGLVLTANGNVEGFWDLSDNDGFEDCVCSEREMIRVCNAYVMGKLAGRIQATSEQLRSMQEKAA